MNLQNAVVVITGASSGIGRAAALEFASKGSAVVVAARSEKQLQEVAKQCDRLGGRGLATAVDVKSEGQVRELARKAIETFGKIDVWVNNAGVTLFGRIEETPYEACRQVMETNFFGYLHGARGVIPHFREQGRGVLINVSSMVGKVGQPYTSMYVASKFAINGFSECLRMELMDAPDIHVCTVLAGSIDTPLFQHGANYTGRAAKPIEPVYSAEKAADTIVRLAEHPRREVYVGSAAAMLHFTRTIAPPLAERMVARQVEADHFQARPAPTTSGNLENPMTEWNSISGGWRHEEEHNTRKWVRGLSLLGIGFGLGCSALNRRRRQVADRSVNLALTPDS
jgi:short-subunit dehydrogenase